MAAIRGMATIRGMGTRSCRALGPSVLALLLGGCGEGDARGTDVGNATEMPMATTSTTMTASDGGMTTGQVVSSTSAAGDSGTSSGSGTTATVDSTSTDSTGPAVEPCLPGHVCFVLDGVFHVPDEATPTAIYEIPLPAGVDFHIVEVELEVTHGGWYPDDPAGLHNIFWLHRGTFDDFTWAGGVAGYVNARGPGNNVIRTRHDLDVLDLADSQTFNINGIALQPDHTYRVFYRYDTVAAEVLVEITEGDAIVAQGTDIPTTDLIRNTQDNFFIWFANGTDVAAPGPEVPSLGWTFADLRVEFIP